MNEQQLRYIDTIAREGSILKAAALLDRNPSTLTRVLKKCEEDLSVSLFKRTKSGMVPTAEGEKVVEFAEDILSRLEELKCWTEEQRALGEEKDKDGETSTSPHTWSKQEIRYLLAIREQKNISGAAKELYIAQPSLSEMLKTLETSLGLPIFRRQKSGVGETTFGALLLDRLESVMGCYEDLEMELEEFRQMKKGTITFGIPLNLGTYLLPMIVPVFRQRFPGIKLQIKEDNSSELERLMIAGKIDFCVLHFHEAMEQVEYDMFFEDPFYLVIPKASRGKFHFPQERELTKEDLLKLERVPFVMVSRRQKLRQVADRILKLAGISPDICCTTKSMETAKRLVAAGMGVTFLPYSYLNLYSGIDGLECYPLDSSLKGTWKLTVASLKGKKMPRSSREFLKVIKESLS